jgi:hypothetical protein
VARSRGLADLRSRVVSAWRPLRIIHTIPLNGTAASSPRASQSEVSASLASAGIWVGSTWTAIENQAFERPNELTTKEGD